MAARITNGKVETLSAAEEAAFAALTPVVPPSQAELTAYAAARRYQVEVGGCTWSTYTVATDRESQSKMIAEMVAISTNIRVDPSPWKFKDGTFASLTNAEAYDMILASRTHIADAFAKEGAALVGIAGGTITTYAEIDAVIV